MILFSDCVRWVAGLIIVGNTLDDEQLGIAKPKSKGDRDGFVLFFFFLSPQREERKRN